MLCLFIIISTASIIYIATLVYTYVGMSLIEMGEMFL